MPGSINKVTILGRLGQDPVVQKTKNDSKMAHFSVATNSRSKKRDDGSSDQLTEWHRVAIFNEKLAEIAEKYLAKGKRVYLEGQLMTNEWTDPEGNTRYMNQVVLVGRSAELILIDQKVDSEACDAA